MVVVVVVVVVFDSTRLTTTPLPSQEAELLQWPPSHALIAQRYNERHCGQLVGYAIINNHALPLSVSDRGATTTRSSSSYFKFGFGPHTIVFRFNNHISLLCARCACCRYCDQSLWVTCVPSRGLLYDPYSIDCVCETLLLICRCLVRT
jgi:hypothetical protein